MARVVRCCKHSRSSRQWNDCWVLFPARKAVGFDPWPWLVDFIKLALLKALNMGKGIRSPPARIRNITWMPMLTKSWALNGFRTAMPGHPFYVNGTRKWNPTQSEWIQFKVSSPGYVCWFITKTTTIVINHQKRNSSISHLKQLSDSELKSHFLSGQWIVNG